MKWGRAASRSKASFCRRDNVAMFRGCAMYDKEAAPAEHALDEPAVMRPEQISRRRKPHDTTKELLPNHLIKHMIPATNHDTKHNAKEARRPKNVERHNRNLEAMSLAKHFFLLQSNARSHAMLILSHTIPHEGSPEHHPCAS